MSTRSKPQWVVSGFVEAPVDKVWRGLLENTPNLTPQERAVLAGRNAAPITKTIAHEGGGKMTLSVDPQRHSVTTQGEWWYRGVFSVEAHSRGSCVRYSVFNIAPGIGWWAAQLVQGPQHARTMQPQLNEMLEILSKHSG